MTAASPPPASSSATPSPLESAPTESVFSPLHDVHVEAKASFTDFAGWQMPVRYSGDLSEHHAVRKAAAIFDLSHMAELSIQGPDAAAFLDFALAGKLSAIALGQAKYSLLLAESGGIVDDVVVYRTGESAFMVVANAGNHVAAFEALRERSAGFDVEVIDSSDSIALIAVQGPRSREIVAAAAGITFDASQPQPGDAAAAAHAIAQPGDAAAADAAVHPLDALKYYWSLSGLYGGAPLLVARTGYTGEDGFELYVDTNHAVELWRELVVAGEPFGLIPAGLASRDTLRLEAGMPLYGHELGLTTLPSQAGLGRVPNFSKGDFVGRAALEAAAEGSSEGASANPGGPAPRVLVGLVGEGKRAARAGYALYATAEVTTADLGGTASEADAPRSIGEITSGVLSPTLGVPIAMAYLDPEFAAPETAVSVDVRGSRLTFRVTPLPFYSRKRA